jgi:hypothetical protein
MEVVPIDHTAQKSPVAVWIVVVLIVFLHIFVATNVHGGESVKVDISGMHIVGGSTRVVETITHVRIVHVLIRVRQAKAL